MRHTRGSASRAALRVARSPLAGGERQREDGRVVLRCAAGLRDLDDAADHARAVGLDHAQDGLGVLERQLALADVVRAALGAEDQEAVEPLPVVTAQAKPPALLGTWLEPRIWLVLRSLRGSEPGGERVQCASCRYDTSFRVVLP